MPPCVLTLPRLVKHCGQNTLRIRCLLRILSSLRFLGRQGLPIGSDGDATDGNYIQLLIVYLTVTLNFEESVNFDATA